MHPDTVVTGLKVVEAVEVFEGDHAGKSDAGWASSPSEFLRRVILGQAEGSIGSDL